MREVKFRAWDKERKQMRPFAFISTVRGAEPESLDDAIDIAEESQVLMQYTGLKDKNGVEIYEGDIVKVLNTFICEVVYQAPRYCFKRLKDGVYWQPALFDGVELIEPSTDQFEVIGSIYENPELLGAES